MPAVPDVVATILLVALLLVLLEILRAIATNQLLAPRQTRRPIEFDWTLLAVASVFILLNLIPRILQLFYAGPANVEKKPLPSPNLDAEILTQFVVVAVLLSLIVARGKNRLTDFGIDLRGWLAEVRFGGLAFLAFLPFVIVIMAILGSFRSDKTQNPLLTVLQQTGSPRTLLEAVFVAVVAAPLAEESLFRVAFQGMLETRLSRVWAIAIPAFVFAGVHGPYDALPLLPLALGLGVLYHLRRSYVAVVTAHSLFNATNVMLAIWLHGPP